MKQFSEWLKRSEGEKQSDGKLCNGIEISVIVIFLSGLTCQ